jgi:hypothetical protein
MRRRTFIAAAAASVGGAGVALRPAHGAGAASCHSVRDHGATGDGRANDGPAIQSALDAAAASGGGIVLVPAGEYLLTDGYLRYASNVRICGVGPDSLIRNGTGKRARQMLMPVEPGVHSVVVSDLRLDQRGDVYGNDGHSQCVSIDRTTGVLLSGVIFENACTMALWCETGPNAWTTGLTVANCRVFGSAAGGFSFFGNIRESVVTGCELRDVRDDAIAFQDVPGGGAHPLDITIAGNRIADANRRDSYGSTPNGILVYGGDRVSVIGNAIDRTGSSGISISKGYVRRATNVTVVDNRIERAGRTPDDSTGVPGHGIYALESDGVTMMNNRVTGSRMAGLAATLSTGVTAVGNEVVGNGASGIRIDASSGVQAIRNRVTDSGADGQEPYGILIISASPELRSHDVLVLGNRVGNDGSGRSQRNGIFLVGADTSDTLIQDNDLRGNADAARGGMQPAGARWVGNREVS